ncbi:uncharacterized protein MYCFIDRAFT_200909 [Pseudocercospora fijiensis CIRAD86]|uniref:Uncharacterized protein n=1 Tax=Pseudocercospora fijiensis (strain CIRAD86) TaxID=383855 RepID=M2YGI3_PSEFD|nr:uncharacterized protein MYCFIDRAFT_200909 [Pseudocercospora fijiensis CIRAD86]EME76910.1 hypothetical protein MYCFIDRAFT_200909 [Pseudocercospora fijiensis CIRAD86]
MGEEDNRAAQRRRYASKIIKLHAGQGGDFPDDHVDTVTSYAHWLYHREISDVNFRRDGKLYPDHMFLVSLWLFGDKVQDDKFCDAAICAVLDTMDDDRYVSLSIPDEAAINKAYDSTPFDSPLRRFFVAVLADHCQEEWFETNDYNAEFVQDLAKELVRRRGFKNYKSYSKEAVSATFNHMNNYMSM